MPYTINGIGTHYFGKNRIHKIRERCEHCNAVADLVSYDTGNYFVVLFIPLIPLGKKRILSECPNCSKHRVLPLTKWEQLKSADVSEVTTELKSNSNDPEVVKKVFGIATGYQDEPLLMLAASAVTAKFSNNADVLASLGECLEYFSRLGEAENAYRASVKLNDVPETRERLAMTLLKQLRPAEARTYLQHIIDEKLEDKLGFLWMLAEGYQAVGDHPKAVETLAACGEIKPEWLEDKGYKAMLKQSEKMIAKGKSKPIASAWFGAKAAEGYSEGGAGGKIAQWIPAIVAIVLLTTYLGLAIVRGMYREVHIVNGLNCPYVAVVNGKDIPVGPRSRTVANITEGMASIKATSVQNQLDLPASKVEISTNFWTRAFYSPVIIINPDRTAAIEWEKSYYGENPGMVPDPEYEKVVGQVMVIKWGVDYPFAELPQQIKMKGGSKPVGKTRVGFKPIDTQNVSALGYAVSNLNPNDAGPLLLALASAEPQNEVVVGMMANACSRDLVRPWFDARISRRPIELAVHRQYQNFVKLTDPERPLEAEYRAMTAKDPDNADLQYLLARSLDDPDEQGKILGELLATHPNHYYTMTSLGHLYLAQGRFDEARPLVDRACIAMPANLGFTSIRDQVWCAQGRAKDLADTCSRDPSTLTFQLPFPLALLQELRFRAIAGDSENFKKRIQALRQSAIAQQVPLQAIDGILGHLQSQYYLMAGDWNELRKLRPESDGSRDRLLIDKKWEEASNLPQSPSLLKKDDPGLELLAIGVLAELDGKVELGQQIKARSAALLLLDSPAKRSLKKILLGEADMVEIETFLKLNEGVEDKVIILAALGQRFPENKKACFELANKLNFNSSVESHLLKTLFR